MNSALDENSVATITGILDSDGITIQRICVNPTNHALCVSDGNTGTDNGNNANNAMKDENGRSVLIAVSSDDGITPVEVYVDTDGKLLIQTT